MGSDFEHGDGSRPVRATAREDERESSFRRGLQPLARRQKQRSALCDRAQSQSPSSALAAEERR